MRHCPIAVADLIKLLHRGPPMSMPTKSTHLHLQHVLASSLGNIHMAPVYSPFIVVVNRGHFSAVFVDAECKRLYFFDPLGGACHKPLWQAFMRYHRLHDALHRWTYETIQLWHLGDMVGANVAPV